MKSDVLVSLIKEVVKSEVKKQVKEEIIKLIKSGDISLNTNKKSESVRSKNYSLAEMIDGSATTSNKKQNNVPVKQMVQPVREFTKDPLLNEILNSTQPFTSAQRADTGMAGGSGGGGSILDALQPQVSMEGDWETMDYRDMNIPQQQISVSDNPAVDTLAKALTRDYTELVKRFK